MIVDIFYTVRNGTSLERLVQRLEIEVHVSDL